MGNGASTKPSQAQDQRTIGVLTAPSKEGFILKQSSVLHSIKRQWCKLHEGSLWFSREQWDKPDNSLSLAGVKGVKELPDAPGKKGTYALEISFEDGRTVPLYAESADDREGWLQAIRSATQFANINERFELKNILGSGGFSEVKMCVEKATGQQYAAKIINRSTFLANKKDMLTEITIMRMVKHPNIAFLKQVIEARDYVYIIQELMTGGDLVTRILEKGSQTEKDASSALYKIMLGISYLHEHGIIHRDLKLENCVYTTPGEDAQIKLIDFGLSKLEGTQETGNYRLVGTPEYMAPEILRKKGYEKPVDMWAAGVLTYILLSGCYPFSGDSNEATFREIVRGRVEFPHPEWDHISEAAKVLIQKLLQPDPTKRLNANQALQDPWLMGAQASENPLPQTNIDNLRKYAARRKFKKAIIGTMAINMLSEGILSPSNNNTPRNHTSTKKPLPLGSSGTSTSTLTAEPLPPAAPAEAAVVPAAAS